MATVSDIISGALRRCRIFDSTNPEKITNGLQDFNTLLKSLDDEVVLTTLESFTMVVDTGSYTIGDGADFDSIRPTRIISAYLEDSGGTSYLLDCGMAKKDYDNITDKDYSARPNKLYYYPAFPNGTIYFDTVPAEADTLYITSLKPTAVYGSIGETILQPPEYEKFLIYALTLDIAPTYGIKLDPTVLLQYEIEKSKIVRRYSQPVPEAKVDKAILRQRRFQIMVGR